MEQSLQWILNRTSIRSYTRQPVPQEKLEQIIRAGMAAPCAVNEQLWEFIAVTDPAILNALGEKLPNSRMLSNAAAAILVCGDLDHTFATAHNTRNGNTTSPFWIMDCSAATENILLAAEILGLGAVWTAVYPNQTSVETVRQVLSLPEHITPLNAIPIGYPAAPVSPKDKWNPAKLHWNRW